MKYRIVGKYKNNKLIYKVQKNPLFGFPLFWTTVTYWGPEAPHPDLAIPGCCTVNCVFSNSKDAEKCLRGLIKEEGISQKQFIAWLEQKSAPQWKPSDEQITWLYRAADDASKDSRMKQILNELLSDLKKLREE